MVFYFWLDIYFKVIRKTRSALYLTQFNFVEPYNELYAQVHDRSLLAESSPSEKLILIIIGLARRSYHYGPETIEKCAPDILRAAIPKAESFWNAARSITDLPGAFERVRQHLSTGGLGFYNYTQHPLAYACVVAMNGKPDAAEEEFRRYHARLSEAAQKKLRKLFVEAGGYPGQ